MIRYLLPALAALPFCGVASAQEQKLPNEQVEYADPLAVEVRLEDVERFAELFRRTQGHPTADQIQHEYLDPGSYGISIFTPNRIANADNLARTIAAQPELYSAAIDRCLPLAKEATPDLRSIYLGLQGALPGVRLPQVYFVMGADNSGGTAGKGAQVLGLEVLCRISETPADFRRTLRHFFAHETVHVLQEDAGLTMKDDVLLRSMLAEGAADFIAQLVTGEDADPARSEWSSRNAPMIWAQFGKDITTTRNAAGPGDVGTPSHTAFFRWIGNAGGAENGWPGELGYWVGAQIWKRIYDDASDKRAVLDEMLTIENPRDILRRAEAAGLPLAKYFIPTQPSLNPTYRPLRNRPSDAR